MNSQKVNQSGRSMVEMLGIMAIVGVLSITGVYGYTKAMERYRANELLNEAMKRAALVAGQLAGDGGLPPLDTDSSGRTYVIGKPNDKQFTLSISNVKEEQCALMKQMMGSSVQDITCENDTATLTFNNDLSQNNPNAEGNTPGNAQTHAYDGDQSGCEEAGYQYCADNTCITKAETCPGGSILCADTFPGTSEENTGGYAGEVEGKVCRCPAGQAYSEANGCIPACSGHGTLNENNECVCQTGYSGVVCENQPDCGDHGTWSVDKCQCNDGWYGPLCDSDCDGFKNTSGQCVDCSYTEGSNSGILGALVSECTRCKNRKISNVTWNFMGEPAAYCLLTADACDALHDGKGFQDMYDGCYSCSVRTVPNGVTADECAKCENRELYVVEADMGICGLKNCDGFKAGGSCYSCFEIGGKETTSTECNKCPNRKMYNGLCVLKECNGIRDYGGLCHYCLDPSIFDTSPTECAKCDNRFYRYDEYDEYNNACVIKNTEECENGFMGTVYYNNWCWSCLEKMGIETTANECGKCDNREMYNGYCALKNCNDFRDNTGMCFSCSYEMGIQTTANECAKCENREMIEYYDFSFCVLTEASCQAKGGNRDERGFCMK